MYFRFLILLAVASLTACLQTTSRTPAPTPAPTTTVAMVQRPAAIDPALEAKVKASVIASLPAGASATVSELRIVDYMDLQNNQRWVVCGKARIAGGATPGTQVIAYAPHTDIVRFGPGNTKPQEACAQVPPTPAN
jgi:uncharacterized lipoprotein YbaY